LIGSVQRELLDQILFWNANDLQNKLDEFKHYYNDMRGHCGINGGLPAKVSSEKISNVISLDSFKWKKHCCGLFQLPVAA